MKQLRIEIEETQKRLESLILALKKAENKPEMIDLSDGIAFVSEGTGEDLSIGIQFNKGNQVLSVDTELGVFHVEGLIDNDEDHTLNNSEYCLIKSTREECMQTGVVFVSMVPNLCSVNIAKQSLFHLGIALDIERKVYIKGNNIIVGIMPYSNVDYYKLVKRSEV